MKTPYHFSSILVNTAARTSIIEKILSCNHKPPRDILREKQKVPVWALTFSFFRKDF